MAASSFPISPATTLFTSSKKPIFSRNFQLTHLAKKSPFLILTKSATDNGAGNITSPTAASTLEDKKIEKKEEEVMVSKEEEAAIGGNGFALKYEATDSAAAFKDPRWVKGNWDLSKFEKNRKTDWDAVIDAEARRRKWLQDKPETSNNNEPVVFDSSIVPWWAWIKRYHLPEAELLNGRAAMIGFFMAYFVDSLTGVGLVDQMGNFFCKTLLFIAVAGVLFIRKNEDVESLKKLFEEVTFYDKQWQATWKEEDTTSTDSKSK